MRLFCFPYAGGNAATYRPWAEALTADVELVAVDPPGRANRIHEAPIDNLEDFLAALVPAMTPFLDKPSAFFGHCLGRSDGVRDRAPIAAAGPARSAPPVRVGRPVSRRLNRFGRFEEVLLAIASVPSSTR